MTSMGRVAMTLAASTTSHWALAALAELVEDDLEAAGQGEQRVVAQVGGVAAVPYPLGMIRT